MAHRTAVRTNTDVVLGVAFSPLIVIGVVGALAVDVVVKLGARLESPRAPSVH